jgi:hypothetical protein
MFRRLTFRAALCSAVVLGLLAGPTGLAGPAVSEAHIIGSPGVIVARGFFVLVTFTDAKCSVSASHGFTATAKGSGGAHVSLHVHIDPFEKFGTYPLDQGRSGGPILKTFISYTDSHHVDFASNFIPPYPVDSLGEIDFGDGGRQIGVGFHPMFNSSGSDAVIVTGVMACHYPRNKTKH